VIGTLVPKTGSLAHLGPAEAAGIALAVKEVNAAGGVLGQPLTTIDGDSGDVYTSLASQSVDRELAGKVSAIVGATGSSVTAEVIDKVVASGVALVSPGDGSDKFAAYPSHGLYFRVVPSDLLQASVLAGQLKAGGHRNVAIMHVRDLYGAGLAAELAADITKSGGQVAVSVEYDGQAADFAGEVAQVSAAAPDAVVLVGAGETHKIIAELVAAGVGPAVVPLYLSDLALSNVLAQGLPPAAMDGVEGTRPGAAPSPAFLAALAAQAPDLADVGYAAQAYDAVMLVALAADAARSTTGKAIAAQLDQVGTGASSCASYASCLALVNSGRTIAYVGASGPVPLGSDGSPASGTVGVYRFGAAGTYPPTAFAYVTAQVPTVPEAVPTASPAAP
jgi:ABC-type branched-subunit amino acid transport system substrate-binding protein